MIRSNEVTYITKDSRKAIADRSRPDTRYYRLKTNSSKEAYEKQRNYCSCQYKRERKKFYEGLHHNKISDNKLFWKTMKPFFSEKGSRENNITLIENDVIVSDDFQIAETLYIFFPKL